MANAFGNSKKRRKADLSRVQRNFISRLRSGIQLKSYFEPSLIPVEMKILALVLLSATLVLATPTPTPATRAPTTIPVTSSTDAPSSTTTHKPSSTTEVTTPSTTTAGVSTTTTAPTTASTTTAKTTPTPTTTTTPVPITTEAPATTTLAPEPSYGKWSVVNATSGTACLLLQMALRINVTIVRNEQTLHKIIDLPTTANATGSCGKLEQNLTLSWGIDPPAPNLTLNDNVTLHFVKNETQERYGLHCVEVTMVDRETNQTKTTVFLHNTDEFSTGLTNSYRCQKRQDLPLKIEGQDEVAGYLSMSELQFQAFRSENSTTFGLAKDCAFDTPDVVPIAVGCALAALVVVVLVAYLVGRRRSQAQGYVSM